MRYYFYQNNETFTLSILYNFGLFFFQNINTFPGCIFILAAIVNLVQMSIYIIVFKMKSQFKIHSKDQIEETENNIECSTKL